MSSSITPISGPPADAPEVPHPRAYWATIVPGADAASAAVDHISNVEYVSWLDRLGQAHLESLGWSSCDLLASGAMWFVARHEIDYRLEARAGESLLAATWVRTLRRVKSWRDTIVWRQGDEGWLPVCTATTLWVHVSLESRRSTRPPSDMALALDPLGAVAPPWAQTGAQGQGRR
ncbi:MAG: acyl-CoA thioesterase [Phycisphaerales bacterium]|nr:acyl-CoA thioesterase [Phycisphaerales bacterium]